MAAGLHKRPALFVLIDWNGDQAAVNGFGSYNLMSYGFTRLNVAVGQCRPEYLFRSEISFLAGFGMGNSFSMISR